MSARGAREPADRAPEPSDKTSDARATLEGDRALLDGFRRGEREALTRVFQMYVDDLSLTLRSGIRVEVDGAPLLVGGDLPPWELENLLHETFARAFAEKARSSYDGVRPFGAWLGTIARNLVVDRARKERREARRVVVVEDITLAADKRRAADPAEAAEDRALRDVVDAFVAELDDDDRELFRARYVQRLSLRAAAKALGRRLFPMRKRDAALRLQLLDRLRAAGFCEHTAVNVGKSVLDRGKTKKGARDG